MIKNFVTNKSFICMMNKKIISSSLSSLPLIKNSIFYQFGNIRFNKKRRNTQPKPFTQKVSKQLFSLLQREIQQAQSTSNQPQQTHSTTKFPDKPLQQQYQTIANLQKSLQKIGWKVQQLDGRLQFTKFMDQYKFSAFITIKPPLQISQAHKQMLVKKKQHEIQFIQAQIKTVRQKLMQLKVKGPIKGPSRRVGPKPGKDAKDAEGSASNNSIENVTPSVLEKRLKQLAGILFHLQQQKMDSIYDQFICQISLFIEKNEQNNPAANLQQINLLLKQKSQPIHFPSPINQIKRPNPKTPPKPYLNLQYIANSKYAQLNQLKTYYFSSNNNQIIKNRIQRLSNTTQEYTGPQLENLDPQLVDLVGTWLVNDLELRKQVFMTMYNLFVLYENREYVEWLKEMKEMLVV